MPTDLPSAGSERGGAIHDIGYRHYDGPRLGVGYIQRSLFVDTVRGAFGFGRSTRSKVMPVALLVVISLPAFVIAIVTSVTGAPEVPGGYPGYPFRVQPAIAIFLASQAPAVMSRDLRYRMVSLYFSRPLERHQYVQAKYAGMAVAVLAFLAVPLTILLAGALLAELPVTDQFTEYVRAIAGAVLYALVLSGVALVIAALTPRRGLGVAAVIAVLLVLSGLQAMVQGLAGEFGQPTLAGYAGLISPFSIVDGVLATVLGADGTAPAEPPGTLGAVVFTAATVLLIAGSYVALLARYRKVSVS